MLCLKAREKCDSDRAAIAAARLHRASGQFDVQCARVPGAARQEATHRAEPEEWPVAHDVACKWGEATSVQAIADSWNESAPVNGAHWSLRAKGRLPN